MKKVFLATVLISIINSASAENWIRLDSLNNNHSIKSTYTNDKNGIVEYVDIDSFHGDEFDIKTEFSRSIPIGVGTVPFFVINLKNMYLHAQIDCHNHKIRLLSERITDNEDNITEIKYSYSSKGKQGYKDIKDITRYATALEATFCKADNE